MDSLKARDKRILRFFKKDFFLNGFKKVFYKITHELFFSSTISKKFTR